MTFAEHKMQEIESIIGSELHVRVKDEFRRSAKENGFDTLSDEDFKQYLEDRKDTLCLMIGNSSPEVKAIIDEIYVNMKEVKNRTDKELVELQEKFTTDINKFVEEI
jgi:hypothetical protein